MRTRRHKKRTRRRRGGRSKGFQFTVSYSGIPVRGQELSKDQSAIKPQIQIPKGHYVVMADSDAVNPDWIHWIVTPEKEILPYQGPNPPPGSGIHTYKLYLVAGNPPLAPKSRGGQNVAVLAPNLVAIAEFTVAA